MVSDGADVKTYVVVFKQQSGQPSNADRLVADAGGTIVVRLEEIGGIGVESANPDFAAAMEKDSGVFAAGEDVTISIPSADALVGPDDAGNNGGTVTPPGPDPQPGTEPLYHQQWDKIRINASATRAGVDEATLDTALDYRAMAKPHTR